MSNLGTWDAPLENALSIVGVHAVVLYTGQVLYWCFDERAVGQINIDLARFNNYFPNPNLGSYQIWDPTTGKAGPVKAIGRNSFCAGQCALPDGKIFVAGGQDLYGAVEMYLHDFSPLPLSNWGAFLMFLAKEVGDALIGGSDDGALKDIHTYDPASDSWSRWPDMPEGRYYPTCLELDNGTTFVAGGLSNLQRWVMSGANWCQNDTAETYSGDALALPRAPSSFRSADQYPIIRLLPGTRTLFVHIETTTSLFDLNTGAFIPGATFMPPGVGMQTYPMQSGHVLLPQRQGDPPRVLIVGGSTATGFDFDTQSTAPGVRDAFIFDFDATSPTNSSWRTTLGQLHRPRLLGDTVLLPDGTVFVVNGIISGAAAGYSGPVVRTAEIFDPSTELFTEVAPPSEAHPRGYHATAVLLPDARVAIAGNTAAYNPEEIPPAVDDVSIEIYNPPYLSEGPRPVIVTPIPAVLGYGQAITVTNPTPAVDAVMLMRQCAVTHSVDMDQRAIVLDPQPSSNSQAFTVTMPTDRSLAPPGPYMLFFLSRGVPSEATLIFLGSNGPSQHGEPIPPPNCADGAPYPAATINVLSGSSYLKQSLNGDVTIQKIANDFVLELESKHGSITIDEKIEQSAFAVLTACGKVEIGEKIDQHSQATILTRGNVLIGQGIDQESSATITSVDGSIEIGEKIDKTSEGVLTARTFVYIGQKIDQHSTAVIIAEGDVILGEGISAWAQAEITSLNGSIKIGQAVDSNALAVLRAPNGHVTIGQNVSGGATVEWEALTFTCPNVSGGTVIHL